MNKYYVLFLLIISALIFAYCSSSKKASKTSSPKLVYESSVQNIISASCSPCHIPSRGGKKKAFDNYANAKADIDSIIYRIELNPGDKGFMPFKNPRLSDSAIAVFKQWRADGLLEK
ncbi:MAG: hypothetical protein ACSLE0_14985 [Chitinophagaceae bacterium]